MINEVMAKAITGIDENLISDAENIKKKSNIIRPVFSLCAVAACLVLVFTFIFAFGNRYSGPKLFMNDSEIVHTPITVDSPVAAMTRSTDYSFIVYLTLNTKENTKLSVSGGEMHVVSANDTDTLYYTGTEYTTDIPVNIHWHVDGSDITKAYALTLNDSETVYTLSYDEAASGWSICKQ